MISLFCGSGGSSLGYKMAGFRELLAVDWSEMAEENMRANFPEVPFARLDLFTAGGGEIMKLAGVERGGLDVLDGSPPCQGFSLSGKRETSDKRNTLVSRFIDILGEIHPKAFVMENVASMPQGNTKGIVKEAMDRAAEIGYKVRARIMNAVNYGVPQSRPRYVAVGLLEGEYDFPAASGKMRTFQWVRMRVKESLSEFAPEELAQRPVTKKTHQIMSLISPGHFGNQVSKKYYRRSSWYNHVKVSVNRPVRTIMAGGMTQYVEGRRLSIAELKVASGFPPAYHLAGSAGRKWEAIGLCVPPPMIEAVARQLKACLAKRR